MATWGELEKAGTKWRDHEEMTWGKLEEFCVINPKTKQIPDDMEVSFVPMQSVSETGDVQTDEVRKASEVKKGFTFFEEGDVLFAKITPCMENGKGGIARGLKNGVGFGSTEFHVLHPDPEKVSSEWLYYLTSWDEFRKQCARNMTGSAGQKRVPKSYLEHYKVNLPPLEEQRRIAALLDKVSDLIAKRRAQLDKLDLLVKARFVEMFGDQYTNPKGWETGTIRDVVSEVKYGTSRPAVEGGTYKYLRMGNITFDGHLDLNDLKHIDIPESEIEKCMVKKGDVLFNRTNSKELVGKTCVFDLDEPMVIAGYIIRIRVNERVLPDYLSAVLNSKYGKRTLADMCKTIVGQANINAKELQNIAILIPPVELQCQFSQFVNQVNKLASNINSSLEKLETLKKALMQQYFK